MTPSAPAPTTAVPAALQSLEDGGDPGLSAYSPGAGQTSAGLVPIILAASLFVLSLVVAAVCMIQHVRRRQATAAAGKIDCL